MLGIPPAELYVLGKQKGKKVDSGDYLKIISKTKKSLATVKFFFERQKKYLQNPLVSGWVVDGLVSVVRGVGVSPHCEDMQV